jgi:hypothetical protein
MSRRHDFKNFDRELVDFRDAVGLANLTMRDAIRRYITMMEALGSAFALYYADLPDAEKAQMKAAFDDLANHVAVVMEEPKSNIYPIKR